MTADTALTVEERLRQLLRHLGIGQAHFAGRSAQDWTGLAARYPEVFASLTLIGGFNPQPAEPLASKLLAVTGDQGAAAATVRNARKPSPGRPAYRVARLRPPKMVGRGRRA
jgi:pimeloyl-ACP methyl ester carboxylesterase